MDLRMLIDAAGRLGSGQPPRERGAGRAAARRDGRRTGPALLALTVATALVLLIACIKVRDLARRADPPPYGPARGPDRAIVHRPLPDSRS